MRKAHSSDKLVGVVNQEFRWHIHRQPQWCTADGWKGLALYVELAHEPKRVLILEFPFKIVNHRNDPGQQRPKVVEKDVIAAISSALEAGWNPADGKIEADQNPGTGRFRDQSQIASQRRGFAIAQNLDARQTESDGQENRTYEVPKKDWDSDYNLSYNRHNWFVYVVMVFWRNRFT